MSNLFQMCWHVSEEELSEKENHWVKGYTHFKFGSYCPVVTTNNVWVSVFPPPYQQIVLYILLLFDNLRGKNKMASYCNFLILILFYCLYPLPIFLLNCLS